MGYRNPKCLWILEYFNWVCKFWGILTAIGLWGIGVEAAYHKHLLGIYLIIAAILLSFLETTFVVNIFLTICIKDDASCFPRFWTVVLWLDYWKKSVLYLIMAVPCFIQPRAVWMAIISGVMLVILTIFYLLRTYQSRIESSKAALDSKESYDRFFDIRFEEITDDMDDINLPFDMRESVADQEEILDV